MKLSSGAFYGNTSKTVSTTGLELMETAYNYAHKLPAHSHESAYFCFVLDGSFTERYENKSRLCSPSTLIFHPAGEKHSDYFHTDARCFNIQMNPQWFDSMRQSSNLLNTPADFYDPPLSGLALRLYCEYLENDEFSRLAIEGLTLEILAESSRHRIRKAERYPPSWLRQAREVLDERFDESLALADLSEAVGVHPVHLARAFRRFYGSTIGEYVRRRRVEMACRQISDTDASLSEVGLAAGFFDQSHFARTFRRFTGLTPSEYRSAFRSRRF
ncbi:MAG: helix-turn-helix domain-containing protein [Pyrinomonadaceae bacterium]